MVVNGGMGMEAFGGGAYGLVYIEGGRYVLDDYLIMDEHGLP